MPVKNRGKYLIDIVESNKNMYILILEIERVHPSDSGIYECIAKISGAEAICNFDLTFNEDENKYQVENLKTSKFQASFNEIPKDQVGADGDKISVTCKVSGNPKPEIKWFKNTEQITNLKVNLMI